MEDLYKKLKTNCYDKALDCLGYHYIYSKQVESLSFWLHWSKVIGILLPVILGGLLSTYFSYQEFLNYALIISAPIALIQLILSTYLTVAGSDEKLKDYTAKSIEYSLLNSEFEDLAKFPPDKYDEFKIRYDILIERERGVSKSNFSLKDKHLRMGMRYGLRNYSRECVGCKIIPLSMKPTKCDVCGNF